MEILLLPLVLVFFQFSGMYYSLSSPNAWDDCFGEAKQTDNWCLNMRKASAAASASDYFKPYNDRISFAKTEAECDKIFAEVSYGDVTDEYELMAYRYEYAKLSESVDSKKEMIVRIPELARQEASYLNIHKLFKESQWSNVVSTCSVELERQRKERGAREYDSKQFVELKNEATQRIEEANRLIETNRISLVQQNVEKLMGQRKFAAATGVCQKEISEIGTRAGFLLSDKAIWDAYLAKIEETIASEAREKELAIEEERKERELEEKRKRDEKRAAVCKRFTLPKSEVSTKLIGEMASAKVKYGEGSRQDIEAGLRFEINIQLASCEEMRRKQDELEVKLRRSQYQVFNKQYDDGKLASLWVNCFRNGGSGQMCSGLKDGTFAYPSWMPRDDAAAIWEVYQYDVDDAKHTVEKRIERLVDAYLELTEKK